MLVSIVVWLVGLACYLFGNGKVSGLGMGVLTGATAAALLQVGGVLSVSLH